MISELITELKSNLLGASFADAHTALGLTIADKEIKKQLQRRLAEIIWEANNQFCSENDIPEGIRTDREGDLAEYEQIRDN